MNFVSFQAIRNSHTILAVNILYAFKTMHKFFSRERPDLKNMIFEIDTFYGSEVIHVFQLLQTPGVFGEMSCFNSTTKNTTCKKETNPVAIKHKNKNEIYLDKTWE